MVTSFNHHETMQNLLNRLGAKDEPSKMIEFARLVKIGERPIYKNFYEMTIGYYPKKKHPVQAVATRDYALRYFRLMAQFQSGYRL